MNCTWNGNIPAVSLEAPASSVADSFGGAIATAPLGKGSILCFMLSNIKLWAVDSEKMKKWKNDKFTTLTFRSIQVYGLSSDDDDDNDDDDHDHDIKCTWLLCYRWKPNSGWVFLT